MSKTGRRRDFSRAEAIISDNLFDETSTYVIDLANQLGLGVKLC